MIRPYCDGDWAVITDDAQISSELFKAGPSYETIGKAAYTHVSNGVVDGAGGVIPYWPGVGLAWIIATKSLRDEPTRLGIVFTRMFKLVTDERFGFWRIEALVERKREQWLEYVTWLGFKWECSAERYGADGSSFERYVWLRE